MTRAVELAQVASNGVSEAFKNRIINGAMVIDQRNAGASVALSNNNTFITDRFAVRTASGSGHTSQRSTTAPSGFTNSLLVTVGTGASPSSSDLNYAFQAIEGFNIADLGWGTASAKSITISFKVRSSLTGTFALSVVNASLNRSYIATFTIDSANTFEDKSVTIAGDTSGTWATDNTLGLYLFFDLGCGSTRQGTAGSWAGSWGVGTSGSVKLIATSGATLFVTGVQLEVGSTATSFDYRPYTTELQLAQRYYYLHASGNGAPVGNAANFSASSFYGILQFPVQMRIAPTISVTTGTDYYIHYRNSSSDGVNSLSQQGSSPTAFTFFNNTQVSGTGGNGGWVECGNASSFVAFGAEL